MENADNAMEPWYLVSGIEGLNQRWGPREVQIIYGCQMHSKVGLHQRKAVVAVCMHVSLPL